MTTNALPPPPLPARRRFTLGWYQLILVAVVVWSAYTFSWPLAKHRATAPRYAGSYLGGEIFFSIVFPPPPSPAKTMPRTPGR